MTTICVNIQDSIKGYDSISAFLTFSYSQHILDKVRTLSKRYWHASTKQWEIAVKDVVTLVNELPEVRFDIKINVADEVAKNTSLDSVPPEDFNFVTSPYAHQVEGFNYGLKVDKFLLADSMGLGKTKQVIDISVAKKIRKGYKHCLIICGVNGLKYNWMDEIKIHSNEEGWVLGSRVSPSGIVRTPTTATKLEDLNNIESLSDKYFLITNVESLQKEEIVTKLQKLCKSNVINMIAFDEIHKCKDPRSQQGKGLLKLSTNSQIAMTGTPILNSPLDLYVILKWLNIENHSFYAFKQHYCMYGGFQNREVIGFRNTSELQSRLNTIMLRRQKNEVLDLPDKVYKTEYVEMTEKQIIIYQEIKQELLSKVDLVANSINPLSKLIRLRQATAWTGIVSSSVAVSAKMDRMEELVSDILAQGEKVIVYSNWTDVTDIIVSKLQNYNPALITGQISDNERQKEKDKFLNDPECKVMVGTIGAMGTGLTLTSASYEIFMDSPWNRADKEQAEDRAHRIGMKSSLTIYTLVTKGTIDERIEQLVYKKGAISDAIVDGEVRKEDREKVLSYLLS